MRIMPLIKHFGNCGRFFKTQPLAVLECLNYPNRQAPSRPLTRHLTREWTAAWPERSRAAKSGAKSARPFGNQVTGAASPKPGKQSMEASKTSAKTDNAGTEGWLSKSLHLRPPELLGA